MKHGGLQILETFFQGYSPRSLLVNTSLQLVVRHLRDVELLGDLDDVLVVLPDVRPRFLEVLAVVLALDAPMSLSLIHI